MALEYSCNYVSNIGRALVHACPWPPLHALIVSHCRYLFRLYLFKIFPLMYLTPSSGLIRRDLSWANTWRFRTMCHYSWGQAKYMVACA